MRSLFCTIGVFVFFLFFLLVPAFAVGTPTFAIYNVRFSYTTDDNVTIYDSMKLVNLDDSRSVTLVPEGLVSDGSGWIGFESDSIVLAPGQERVVNFTITIPDNVCEGNYEGMISVYLADYDGMVSSAGSMSVRLGSGRGVVLDIESGRVCTTVEPLPGIGGVPVFSGASAKLNISNDNSRLVYVDIDGDQVYEPEDGEKIVNFGVARLYDSGGILLRETDLSVSGGSYEVPNSVLSGSQSFSMSVFTDVISNGVADRNAEGNLYVDRVGFSFQNVTDYQEIVANIDLRSRNLDHVGDFALGTLSIGPDDKDKIISPLYWDNLVAGTAAAYIDLDHDGRVDPDDKDHIISLLYWDFPN